MTDADALQYAVKSPTSIDSYNPLWPFVVLVPLVFLCVVTVVVIVKLVSWAAHRFLYSKSPAISPVAAAYGQLDDLW